ncbi:uncharacterized protein LOC126822726 isoform X3 [Patella vulgata]|uniref:uncharacterized protein LOC126822726 isoform X3 n=1 Tax=Patella vulgata TaxID=6465 RepID=UPI0024A85EE6|nr:uncharacterized protein LOC126822726 isoform X3 [Patella vulgata]
MCGLKSFYSRFLTFNILTNVLRKINGIFDYMRKIFQHGESRFICHHTLEGVKIESGLIQKQTLEGVTIESELNDKLTLGVTIESELIDKQTLAVAIESELSDKQTLGVTIDRSLVNITDISVDSVNGNTIPVEMGVPKSSEKEKTMEMWYICRFLSPKHEQLKVNEGGMEKEEEAEISLEREIVEDEEENSEVCEELNKNSENDNMEAITENGLAEQLALVQEMVYEIKQGFVEVMTELSHSQTTDKNNWRQVTETQDGQQEQINKLQTTVSSIKTDVVGQIKSLTSRQVDMEEKIKSLETERDGLLDRLDTLHRQYNNLLYELVRCGSLPDTVRNQMLNGNLEFSNPPPWPDKDMNHSSHSKESLMLNGDTDVTSIACKSLNLSQALKEKCMNLNLSESSDEDHSHPWQQQMDIRSNSSKGRGYHSPRKISQVDNPDTGPRLQAIEELIQSEKDYCSQIWAILDNYLAPLQERHYLSAREISVLIPPYVGQIYDHHCQILSTLQERVSYWGWNVSIGDIFSRMTDSEEENIMSIYREYVADIPASVGCLRRHIIQSRNFKAFIKAQKGRSCDNNDILSLMMAPLQRIPRYTLLLQQVLKHTSTSHPDHYNLQSSLVKLRTFVDQFNSEMSHTMMALNSDHPRRWLSFKAKLQSALISRRSGQSFRSSASGSSCEAGHLPSTRDSGIHSNGENNHRSARLPDNLDRGNFLPDWIEQSTGYLDQDSSRTRDGYRDLHRMKLAARSQPDLSSYNKSYNRHNHLIESSRQRNVDSLSSLHHADNKFKRPRSRKLDSSDGLLISKRPVSVSHSHVNGIRDYNYVNSPRGRPSSAIDFMMPAADTPRQRSNRDHLLNRPHTSLGPLTRNNNFQIQNGRNYQDNYPGEINGEYPEPRNSTNLRMRESSSQAHMMNQVDAERYNNMPSTNGDLTDGPYYNGNTPRYQEKVDEYPNLHGVSQYHADIEDEDDTAVSPNENLDNNDQINYHQPRPDVEYRQNPEFNLQPHYEQNSYNNSDRAHSDISHEDIDHSVTRSLRLDDINADPVMNSTEHEHEHETEGEHLSSHNPPPAHHVSHSNISDLENCDIRNEFKMKSDKLAENLRVRDLSIDQKSQSICVTDDFANLQKNLESKKKKKQTKRYTSLEHIPMAADDDSHARRRHTIKSSLKNLFSKKNSEDDLLIYDRMPPPRQDVNQKAVSGWMTLKQNLRRNKEGNR